MLTFRRSSRKISPLAGPAHSDPFIGGSFHFYCTFFKNVKPNLNGKVTNAAKKRERILAAWFKATDHIWSAQARGGVGLVPGEQGQLEITIGGHSHGLPPYSTTSWNTKTTQSSVSLHQSGRDKERFSHHIHIKHASAQDPPVKLNQLSRATIRTLSSASGSLRLQPSMPYGLSTTPFSPVGYCSLYCPRFPNDTKQTFTYNTMKKTPV